MPKGYQFISWFPYWRGCSFTRLDPAMTSMVYMYVWYLSFGFWELRKWSQLVIPGAARPGRSVTNERSK